MTKQFDVAVIGGGAAGLSAAVALGRSRRTVIVLDDGTPRNAPADGVHNFLTRDGTPPAELLAIGRGEVEAYGGLIVRAAATQARRSGSGFAVTTGDGEEFQARRLVVATGLTDELPDVPGVRELWGSDVVHCAYCHGWEHAGQAIGVLGSGPLAVHQVLLFRQLTDDLVLFQHTAPPLTAEQAEQLAALGVRVVTGPVERLERSDGRLTGVRMRDGLFIARAAVVVGPRMAARSRLLSGLGLEPVPHPLGAAAGEFIESDQTGRTAAAGVWVAGNVTDIQAQVITAAAQGLAAGAAVNADLVEEDTQRAVDAARAHVPAGGEIRYTQEFWDERYRSADRLWSGQPNPQLVAQAAGLTPGDALDAGSGEGADAIWLARQGWTVTAADLSEVALGRAARHAAADGDEIAQRITWLHEDLLSWDPGPDRFDLVSLQFLHLPPDLFEPAYRRLAAAVRPGGTLLVVMHHADDVHANVGRPSGHPGLFPSAKELTVPLDPGRWEIVVSAAVGRPATDLDGQPTTVKDTVVRARRRA